MTLCRFSMPTAARRGLTLLEVLIALTILTAGLLTLAAAFPRMLEASRDAELLTAAAGLAQQKAEEIRRDDTADRRMVTAIQALDQPSAPITFPTEPRLSYSFCGRTLMFSDTGIVDDPRSLAGVARVIIRYAPTYRPSQEVIYELRFN